MNKNVLFLILVILIVSSLMFFGCVKIITSIGDDGDEGGGFTITIDYKNVTGPSVSAVNKLFLHVYTDDGASQKILEKSTDSANYTFYVNSVNDGGCNDIYFLTFVDDGNGVFSSGDIYTYNDYQSLPLPLGTSLHMHGGENHYFSWCSSVSNPDWYVNP